LEKPEYDGFYVINAWKFMKNLFAILLVIILSGCQSVKIKQDDQFISIAQDSTIEIMRSIKVPPNSARAYLQNGNLLPGTGINYYQVNCEIEINTVAEKYQTVQPGKFKVKSVRMEESPIVMSKPVLYASLKLTSTDSDSPVDIKRYYHFALQSIDSNEESDVRALICRGILEEPYLAELPTFEEMQQASGDYIKFNF
jgi:hypothetical protein